MDGFRTIWLLMTLAFLSACVPQEKSTSCKSNQNYNPTLRSCVSAALAADNNKPLVGADQIESATEDTPTSFVVNQGTDIDGDTLRYVVVSGPSSGSLTGCMDKPGSTGLTDLTCNYTPAANFNGNISFTYKINDGYVDSDAVATVTINVSSVNDAPIVFPWGPILTEDTPYTYTFYYSDVEGDLATSCTVSAGLNLSLGACSCNAFGVCSAVITPNANLNSSNSSFSFSSTVTAGAASSTYSETVLVMAVNDAPVISPAVCTTSMSQNSALSCLAPTVTDPDTADLPAQTHTWALAATNTCSWITMGAGTGALTGTPNNSNVGTCNLIYKVTDSGSMSVTASTISMTVTNLAPVVTVSGALTTPVEDGGAQLIGTVSSAGGCTATYCVTNDLLSDGTLSFGSSTDCNTNGTLSFTVVNANNANIFYTPNANYSNQTGFCNVEVTFTDTHAAASSDSTSMIVQEVNDTPTLNVTTIPAQTTNEATLFVVDADTSTATTVNPLIIDEGGGTDEDGQVLSIKVTSSNTTIVPHTNSNIKIFTDSAFTTPYAFVSASGTGVSYSTSDGNSQPLYLMIQPVSGQAGTVTVTVTITDDGLTNGVLNSKTLTKTFTLTVTNKSAAHADWSDVYAVGAKVLSEGTISDEPEVRIGWNDFTPFNDTISGYQVFRSLSVNGPFLTPINTTVISPLAKTFTDTTLTTADAGVVYYYRVMGVSTSNSKLIDTSSVYSSIRVPIPPHNMALMHRRMVNMSACADMGKTSDKFNHHRCDYLGHGGSSGKYDIGKDYFVDRYEASCNFTVSECPESSGVGCIGDVAPTGSYTAANNSIYYDRSTGTCHFRTGGSWVSLANLNASQLEDFAEYNQKTQEVVAQNMAATFPKKPPLARIQQFKAYNYCTAASINPAYGATNKTLMNRVVQMAASAWSSSAASTDALEAGASLDLSISQCNSSNGGGLTFQDGLLSALYDTWTANEAASTTSHSFVMAGSDVTNACQSRYGIQDLVGNVEEWNTDRYYTAQAFTLRVLFPVRNSVPSGIIDTSAYMLDPTYDPHLPYDGTMFTSYLISQPGPVAFIDYAWQSGGGINFENIFLPTGFPTLDSLGGNDSVAVTTQSFNDDMVYLSETNTGNVTAALEDTEMSAITSGGSFQDTTGAGRYTLRFRTACDDSNDDGDCADAGDISANATEENVYTGFRCIIPVP